MKFSPIFVSLFLSASLPAAEIFDLDQINPATIEQSWGEAKIGRTADDRELSLGGVPYQKGIGTHANSSIALTLDGKADEFTAIVGASDLRKDTLASVVFALMGDGRELWNSGVLTPQSPPMPVAVNLKGIQKLILTVDDAGDGVSGDHAIWANATIRYSGKVPRAGSEPILIETDALSLHFKADEGGQLYLNRFGAKDGSWQSPLQGQAYPGTDDCRFHDAPVAVIRANGDSALSLIYDKHSTTEEAPGIRHYIITLKDRVDKIFVDLHYRTYTSEDTIQRWAVLRNGLQEPLRVTRLDSAYWQAPAASVPYLEWYDSSDANEAALPMSEKLGHGRRTLESRSGIRHLAGPVPACVVAFGGFPDEEKTPCLLTSLAWSGSMAMNFDITKDAILATSIGVTMHAAGYPLEPGATLESPKCIFTFSPHGKGAASRNLHHWTRRHGMQDGQRLRLIANDSWKDSESSVTEASVIEMIQKSAKLGVELYTLRDGWFGNGTTARTSDASGLGDWQVNNLRFPNGIPILVQTAKEAGIQLGLGFQPEMVNPRSELYPLRPHWLLRHPGRELATAQNQAVLDLTRPEVREFVYKSINDLLIANPHLRAIRWDANIDLLNPYSPHLGPKKQGKLLYQYFDGYYGALKVLAEKHPGVEIHTSASGGGRADHGALLYSHTLDLSDNSHPLHRLRTQWNFSNFLPAIAASSPVTQSGDFKTKFRFDVCMMGQLALGVDPRQTDPAFQNAAITGIEAYKKVRKIVQFAALFRHRSPFESTLPSLNYVSEDRSQALLLAYQIGYTDRPISTTAPVRGLAPEVVYEISEINLPASDSTPRLDPQDRTAQTGQKWMEQGIPLIFHHSNDSAAILLTSVKTP